MEKEKQTKQRSIIKGLMHTLSRSSKNKVTASLNEWEIPVNVSTPPDKKRKNWPPLPDPPNHEKAKAEDAIRKLPYFHQDITTQEDVKNLMDQYRLQEGYFFLRKSLSDSSSYTISVSHNSGLKHIRIVIRDNGQVSLKEKYFARMDELVQHYSHTDIANEDNIPNIRLRFPIRRQQSDEFGLYITVASSLPTSASHPPFPTPIPKHELQPTGLVVENPRVEVPPEREDRCSCGLLTKEATLPAGWSVHISRDPDTKGRVFYSSPSNETSWELPPEICLRLSPEKQDLIRKLGIVGYEKTCDSEI